jgi:hypothetical protein
MALIRHSEVNENDHGGAVFKDVKMQKEKKNDLKMHK